MTGRKSFVIRIDPRMLAAIEKWAADELRSTNSQIEYILRKALLDNGRIKMPELEKDETEPIAET